ncbi:MAG: hypothetical protein K0S01_1711 [Herbinix sp.]|jgi:hypothetical protein|nr:hypothetical protein [Herbinix sp.]
MFKKDKKSDNSTNKSIIKKMNKISYDEHFTSTSASIDLMKNSNFVDIGDGISKSKENDYEKFTK